jgi:KDO2-lipid IV(A) lauroyltransferase
LTRRTKNAGATLLVRVALGVLGRLSLERALRVGEWVGGMAYRLLGGARALAIEHLRVAFGDELTPTAREHLARASFVNVARCFCELAKIDEIRARRDSYFDADGWERLEAVLAEGRGCVVVTGHIGNWELLGAYSAWRGVPVAAVARRIYAPRLNQLLVSFRQRQGVQTILRESPTSARQILQALKSNTFLAIVMDQDTHAPSVSVPFFGRLARTPAAAASLAIRSDLPVLAIFMQRRPAGGQRVIVSPPFVVQRSGDKTADIAALTRQFNAALEAQIRKNPAEWVWWHRRWRHAPLPHLDLDRDFQYTLPNVAMRGRR